MHTPNPYPAPDRRRLLAVVVLGALVFAGGLALTRSWLPGWGDAPEPTSAEYVERFRQFCIEAGFELDSDEPRAQMTSNREETTVSLVLQEDDGTRWLAEQRRPVFVEVSGAATFAGGSIGYLTIGFGLDGEPWYAQWLPSDLAGFIPNPITSSSSDDLTGALAAALAPAGTRLGEPERAVYANNPMILLPIVGTGPEEHLSAVTQNEMVVIQRRPGATETEQKIRKRATPVIVLLALGRLAVIVLLTVGIFFWLTFKQRIDFRNGVALAATLLVAGAIGLAIHPPQSLLFAVLAFLFPVTSAVSVLVLWSAAESFHRGTLMKRTSGLDLLRRGQLGPRSGRSLLLGWSVGAVYAAVSLVLPTLIDRLSGVWLTTPVVHLPIFSATRTPIQEGAFAAGLLTLLGGIALRFLPVRWAVVATVLGCALISRPVSFHPWLATFVVSAALCAVLALAYFRIGLTALLTAGIVGSALARLAFGATLLPWHGAAVVLTLAVVALPLVCGLVGLSKSHQDEDARSLMPAFLKRIDEQRRLRYEMDLLARMQLGLLPTTAPSLPGYEIEASSVLANEAGGDLYDFLWDPAGRLWIAAGDVAGHGYSCAVAQAMTKASLVSLISSVRTPAGMLHELDRVLRTGGPVRHFTSLLLVCLDPETGEALLANAGHPYPLHFTDGEVDEVVLPGLPLGHGPERLYSDHRLTLREGSVLAVYSDGLYEPLGPDGEVYGFEPPRTILAHHGHRSASQVLEALFAGWEAHLGSQSPPDDTTLVVIKRLAEAERQQAADESAVA